MNNRIAQWALLAVLGLIPWIEPAAKDTLNVVSLAPADGIFRSHFPRFEKAVEANYHGDVDVVLLIDGQVGSEETMMSALRRGRAQYGVLTMAGVSASVPEFSLLMAPYLFDSFEEADFVMDHYVFDFATRLLDERGLLLLKWIDSGWWNVFAQTDIADPKDMHGVRMRASSSAATVQFLKEFGADVITLPFGELVPGLQTGLVEGGATNTSMYSAVALYEHAPKLIMTRHALNPGAIMVNKRWFRRLSPANQDVIWKTMASADVIRAAIRQEEQLALESIRSAGTIPQELTPAQRQAWKAPSAAIHAQLIEDLGGETAVLYERILAGKAAFADQNRGLR
jgi:TRAP-type C4-dicarboxylate transport system substrate-binding protein